MFKRMNLAPRLCILVGIVIVIGFGILSSVVLNAVNKSSHNQAVSIASKDARSYANEINGDFRVALSTVNGIYNSILLPRKPALSVVTRSSAFWSPVSKRHRTFWEFTPCGSPEPSTVTTTPMPIPPTMMQPEGLSPMLSGLEAPFPSPLTDYTTAGAGDYLVPSKQKSDPCGTFCLQD